ncbi:MAG: IPT/TIG domain-containing protein, partial [Tepidisphaeraceae bacterium]
MNNITLRRNSAGSSRKQRKAIICAFEEIESRLMLSGAVSGFTAGDVVVEQVGTTGSGTALSSASAPVYLDEFTPTGTAVITVTIPSTGTGHLSTAGSATSEGQMTLSADGHSIVVPGYGADAGTAGIAATASTSDPRVIDSVDAAGNVTQPVTSSVFFSQGNIRGAASDGSGNYWASGTYGSGPSSAAGINYLGTGAPSSVENATTTNTRVVNVFNNQLYYSTASGTVGIYSVGTGTPTTSGQTGTPLVATGTGASPYAFSISPDGRTIYIADDRALTSGGGIEKFTSATGAAGSFTLAYTFGTAAGLTAGDRGVAVDWSGTNPVIYATTADSTTKLVTITDTGASATATTLATASANTAFRSVALAPTLAVPAVTSVSPNAGKLAGGDNVTINGTGFLAGATVSFGGNLATNVNVVSSTQITATTPAGSGQVDVTVTTLGGTSATSASDRFAYTSAPVVSIVSPAAGFTSGGTPVIITGSNLAGATAVKFGTMAAAGFSVSSDGSQITVNAPANAVTGTVDVTVTTPGGTTAITSSDQFTYVVAPVVQSVSSNSGLSSGGDVFSTVVITGSGFLGATAVKFGNVAVTGNNFQINSDAQITTIYPAHAAGVVDVTVVNTGGSSATSANDQFTYLPTSIATAEGFSSKAFATLDDNPVITAILSQPGTFNGRTYATNWAFLVNDGTGSVDVYGALPSGSTYLPTVGDAITVSGTWSPYNQIPELASITAISKVSSGNPVPTPLAETISDVNQTYLPPNIAGYLVTLQGVSISGISGTFGIANLTGTITDTAGNSMVLYYYPTSYSTSNVNLFGQAIPTVLENITGIVSVSTNTTTGISTAQFTPMSMTPSNIAPTVSSLGPNTGTTNGGNTVTINGFGFTGATAVSFGGTPAKSFAFVSDTQITAVVPAHAVVGPVDVTVTNAWGTSSTTYADQYNYTVAPVVVSLSPAGGNTAGGYPVTINGSGFTGATSVSFAGVNIPSGAFASHSDTQITITTPAVTAGVYDVTVTTPNGTSTTSTADQFTYADIPTVTGISPTSGSFGTVVTIDGTNFINGATVTVGGTAATNVTVNYDGTITATVPIRGSGPDTADVVVTTLGGSSTTSASDQFTYVTTSIATAEGKPSGSLVTLDQNPVITAILSQPATVNGLTTNSWAFLVNDGTGSIDVYGTMPSGSTYTPTVGDAIVVSGTYSPYNQIPELGTLTAISKVSSGNPVPASSVETIPDVKVTTLPPNIAGYLITLKGVTISGISGAFGITTLTGAITDNATPGNSMTLYYWPTSYSAANTNLFGQAIPTGPVNITGIVDVYNSTTPEFIPITIAAAPAVTGLGPSGGALNGGNNVIITGTGFTGASAVMFGATAATSFTVNSPTQITAVAPAEAAGTVDVTVTNSVGTSTTSAADQYTYTVAPVVSSLSPKGGNIAGGTSVIITGTGFAGATAVNFGGAAASSFTVNSATQITAFAPAQAAGAVDVTVTATGGTSPAVAADKFTYAATPTVAGLSTTTAYAGGGTSVIITGANFISGATV